MFKSAKELGAKISAYFAACAEAGVFPDEAGMLLALKLTRPEYERQRLCGEAFSRQFDEARLRRESIIVRDIYASDGRTPSGKIFLARQPTNGGLADRPAADGGEPTVSLLINGKNEYAGEFD